MCLINLAFILLPPPSYPQVLGTIYIVQVLFNEVAFHALPSPQVGWGVYAMLIMGAVNGLTCFPMAKFSTKNTETIDAKGASFKGLGIGMTMLGVWLSWFTSGSYPKFMGKSMWRKDLVLEIHSNA